jgi:hypothetical protein
MRARKVSPNQPTNHQQNEEDPSQVNSFCNGHLENRPRGIVL